MKDAYSFSCCYRKYCSDLSLLHIDNQHPNANLCSVPYLKSFLCSTELFRRKSDGSWVYFLLLGNNRQHILGCTKISFWIRKILIIAKAYMSLEYSQRCCGICNFGSHLFPWCQPCRHMTWPEFVGQLDTNFHYVSLLQIGTRIPCSMLSLHLMSVKH